MTEKYFEDEQLVKFINKYKTYAVIVNIDPYQTFFPKISSRVTKEGNMESNPIHLIGPKLSDEDHQTCFKYF